MKQISKYLNPVRCFCLNGVNHRVPKKNQESSAVVRLVTANRGLTLLEIMVSVVILIIVIGAIVAILNIQRTKAMNVQATSVLQTDAQVALSLFRRDLFMTGYGMPYTDYSILTTDSANSSGNDSIHIYSMALGFEASKGNWSPILMSTQSNIVEVYRHDDSVMNLEPGDTVVIISSERNLLASGLVIDTVIPTTHLAGDDSIPALQLILNNTVSVASGAIVVHVDSTSYYDGISYHINAQKQLVRGDQVFLDHVEDIQFAYGVDEDGSGVIEDNEWYNTLNGFTPLYLSERTVMVRATFVVLAERGLADYRYPFDSLTLENHTYTLDPMAKKYKRAIVRSVTFPRNLKS